MNRDSLWKSCWRSKSFTIKIKDATGASAIEKLFLINLQPERRNVDISPDDAVLPDELGM